MIVREPGGIFTDLDGGELDIHTRSVLAGVPAIHALAARGCAALQYPDEQRPIIHATRDVADSHFLHVEAVDLEFSNGQRRTYERMKSSGFGAVIIVPMLDDGTVLLVREYGVGVERSNFACPRAGSTVAKPCSRAPTAS